MYGEVPPTADAVACPFSPALQLTLASTIADAVSVAGSLMVTEAVSVHPLSSVMVTVYVPAARPVAVAVVCASLSSHR